MAELDGCPGGEGRAAPPLRMVRFKLRFHPNPICASCWRPPCALLRLAPCSGLPGAWPARAGAAGTSSLILPFIPASVNTLPRALSEELLGESPAGREWSGPSTLSAVLSLLSAR